MPPGEAQEGLLTALQGHLYALSGPDGRIRTYDTVTGRLRCKMSSTASAPHVQGAAGGQLANGHLADGLTCLAWLGDQAGSAQARSGNPASTSGLAVGLESGGVRAYDTATGGVLWQAEGVNDGGVCCLALAGEHGLLTSGRDGQVCCLDAHSGSLQRRFRGSKHPVTGAAASPDGSKLLLGGATLALWDLHDGARVAKFTGHTTPVRALAFAPSGRHALSAAPLERSIAVWNTSGSKKAKKLGGAAVASLQVDDPVVALAACSAPGVGDGGDSFYAAAVTEAGEAFVWLCAPEGEAALVATPVARVRVGGSKPAVGGGARADAVLSVGLEAADSGVTLLVVRGNSAKPAFERLPVAARREGGEAELITLTPLQGGLLLPGGGSGAKQHQAGKANGPAAAVVADAEMLGPDNDGELVRPRVTGLAAAASGGRKRQQPEHGSGDEGLLGGGGSAGAQEDGDSSEDGGDLDGEETLGARVAALEAAAGVGGDAAGDAAADDGAAAGAALGLQGPVKADSLAVMLQQALRSGDRALLERCLGISDVRVVRNSVRRLLPVDAAALLRACVERLQSRPVRGQQLAGWIRAVLLHHTAYLMAAPGVQPVMTSLYQTIEARLAMQRTLVSLAGRLDLLLAQAGPGGATGDDEDGAAASGTLRPGVVYEESSSEDGGAEVEVEDAFAPRLESDEDEDSPSDSGGDDDDAGSGSEGGSSDAGEEDSDEGEDLEDSEE